MRGPRRERWAAAPRPRWFSLFRLCVFARVVVPGAGVRGVHVCLHCAIDADVQTVGSGSMRASNTLLPCQACQEQIRAAEPQTLPGHVGLLVFKYASKRSQKWITTQVLDCVRAQSRRNAKAQPKHNLFALYYTWTLCP